MTDPEPTRDAWRAFEEGRLDDADRLWSERIDAAEDGEQRDELLGHHAYVLVAQGRFDEARAVYRGLYERRPSHRHLHQLGMVEREAGELEDALKIFEREIELLPEKDDLALAANLYERALLRHLLHETDTSFALMEACVEAAGRCGDPTMVGVAHRLKGDLLAGRDVTQARAAYRQARDCFARIDDGFGVAEVERRIASLAPRG